MSGGGCPGAVPFCRPGPPARLEFVKCRLITYFLRSPGLEHLDLLTALNSEGAKRVMGTHWILNSEKACSELRDHFSQFLNAGDQLLVAELGPDVALWGATIS